MSNDSALIIQLYWGDKIIYDGGSISYDPPMAQNIIFMEERLNYDQLLDTIYNMMDLDRGRYKL